MQAPEAGVVSLTLDVGPLLPDVTADANGIAEICLPAGSIPLQSQSLTLAQGGFELQITLDLHPFGWDAGLDKSPAPAPELLRTPALTLPEQPFFEPEPASWYQFQIAHPFIFGDLLAFAGTDVFAGDDDEHNPYQLGVATLTDGEVSNVVGPLFPEGGWGAEARNSPELYFDGTTWTMWFHSQEEAGPAIGRATSTDAQTWVLDPNNPVFPNTENGGASHATVIEHEDGLLEMWFAGLGGIGSALSTDNGASFVPFCANPVLPADGRGGYKAPTVAWDGQRYLLSATQGNKGSYVVIWAESLDGLRWTRQVEPVLESGLTDWTNVGVESAQILLDGDDVRLLVVANGSGNPGNGIAIAE